jgi:MoxR-like ATPase
MSDYQFRLIRRDVRQPRGGEVEEHLRSRPSTTQSGSLATTQHLYRPSEEFEIAMNTAIAIGAPLLLTGEPGTGKTQAAYFAAWQLGLGEPLHFQAKTNSQATDLLYEFDTVRYFRDAHLQGLSGDKDAAHLNKRKYIEPRPLWQAFAAAEKTNKPVVLLIDEIDKAPRDFPNDLLHEIQEMRFRIKETDEEITCRDELRPILFITSNDERRLPDAFLRRCVSHHIELTEDLLREAVKAHAERYPVLDREFVDLAISRFIAIRSRSREKPPATGELLAWLQVLAIETGNNPNVLNADLGKLPYLEVLIKTPEDRESIRKG